MGEKIYTLDRHALYEAAVQNPEADLDFVDRVYRDEHGRLPTLLREDFCGTAALAAQFVARRPRNRAFGVDLDPATLEWGREHRLAPLGAAARRVDLRCGDVRTTRGPKVHVQVALNFSFCVFKERAELERYLRAAHRCLLPEGLLFLDIFGGTEAATVAEEERRCSGELQADGRRVRPFTYVWEQASFNPVDNHILCHIHFRVKKGSKGKKRRTHTIRRAFTYDWRLWSVPELCDLLREAGFAWTRVYTEGWDENEEEGDGDYQPAEEFDNDGSWVAYVVGGK